MSRGRGIMQSRLIVAVLAVLVAISPVDAQKRRDFDGNAPIPDKAVLGSLGAQINGNTIAIVSGNINAATMMVAEKGAGLILEDAQASGGRGDAARASEALHSH